MDRWSDEDVAAAFSGGQPDALALVYERFGPLVYSIAMRSLGARSDAEDVTQLTGAAAGALDDTFGTTLFTPGLELGTASTVLRF